MRMNKGISLIVLVITIIIVLILTGVVVLSLTNNSPVSQAKEASFKSNVDSYYSELAMYISNGYVEDFFFSSSRINAGIWDGNDANIDGTVKEYIPSITKEDGLKFEIQSGKLVYVGEDDIEKGWITGTKIEVGSITPIGLGINVIAIENETVNGLAEAYNNPIVPKGFKAVDTLATWPDDWNSGLVIEDEVGNQFVWVPVDGTDVTYAKWCLDGVPYDNVNIGDDSLPAGISSEIEQINKYGGFYIARYEAGKESSNILVSKKLATVWTNVTYGDAKSYSESMYTTNEVKSGLVTGTQWDTTMNWLQNSEFDVTDSRAWGNFSNSIDPANVSGFGSKQVTGYSDSWMANNIYDLAGNTWELTNETYLTERMYRGGRYMDSGSAGPAAYRYYNNPGWTYDFIAFRTALYIL
jgi:hypothetical protein